MVRGAMSGGKHISGSVDYARGPQAPCLEGNGGPGAEPPEKF